MASMITDSESLFRFCDELLDTVDQLKEQLKSTEQAMEQVATDWKDAQFQKFNEKFTEDKERIKPLCDKLEEYESEVLHPLADIVRRYEEM